MITQNKIRSWVITQFMEQPLMQLEYFEIVENKGLYQIMSWEEKGNKVGCIAVLIGEVRLIDNLIFD